VDVSRIYRILAGLVGLGALGVQFALLLERMNGDIAAATLRFFTYFTLLSNIVGAASFLFPSLAPKSAPGRFFARPPVRTAATLYLLVVGAVYHTILASRWDPQGWQLAADIALHTAMPIMMTADWLFITPKRDLRLTLIPPALAFPAAFGAFALAQGAMTGFYPYPFVDVGALGYARVALNLLVLLTLFAGLGAIMTLAGRRFARRTRA